MALILLQVLVLAVTAGAVDDVGVRWQDGGCTLADWKPVPRRQPPPPLQGESLAKSLWKRDLTRRSSPSGTLEVMKADEELRCEVHHQADVVLGYPLSLYWSYTDRKLEVHQDEKARTSPISIMPCYLDGGNPATDGNTWPGNDRYFTAQSDRLTLDLNKDSHLQYRCKASQPDDDDDDTVALTCPLHRWPNVKLKWDVRRGAGTDAVLPPIFAPREEGVYSCTAEGNKDAIEPPRMLYPPQSKQAPPAGTVRFNCTAAGNPKPTVTWYKNGEPLVTSSGAINIRNSTNFERLELVVSSLTVGDAGVYQCIAHNAGGFVSGWAQLNVTVSPVLAPVDVTCAPLSASAVQVRWRPAVVSNSSGDLAYTVSIKLKDKPGANDGVTPPTNLVYNEIRLAKPLTPYQFQVRAYRTAGASNLSHPVVCQGQGVPINMSVAGEGSVLVSWRSFAEQNPGVVVWRLEYKPQDKDDVQNVTLPAGVHDYTLRVSASEPLLVRVLGSRTAEWLPQNLTLVPWVSTTRAGEDYGELDAYVDDVVVTLVRDRSVSLRWRCVRCPQLHKVHVCAQTQQRTEVCRNTTKTNVTLEGLHPETEYELRIQVIAGRAAGKVGTLYNIVTRPDGPAQIKELAHKFVNDSALLLSWSGAGAYTVHYSAHLLLPIESWAAIDVVGNSVLITGIKPSDVLYVMVTGHDPPARSSVITVPPFALTPVESKEKTFVSAAKDEIQYEFVDNDVVIRWAGGGSRLVRYSQNITRPIEDWAKADSSDGFFQFHLDGFNPNLPLYVQVVGRTEQLDGSYGPVLTIPPRPATTNNFYLNLILGCAIGALCVLVILSAYIWRRRRRQSKSARSRRSHVVTSSPEEDGSEMKTVGARLCNGAGEPLLNGHVHITENPASKTPNGRMKLGRRLDSQFEAFDVSRHDADTTQETTLGDSALDLTRSGPKMPDDNMNVEGGFRDNSQQPTLQPNG